MARTTMQMSLISVLVGLALASQAQAQGSLSGQSEALARLATASGGSAQVSLHSATGAARFVRLAAAMRPSTKARGVAPDDSAMMASSAQFLADYGGLFGITSAGSELGVAAMAKDRQGGTHLTYKQLYQGLPVFGAELKTHFDAAGSLTVANGTFVPGIALNARPARTADEAGKTAITMVKASAGRAAKIAALQITLMVYREGLAKGVEGANHLAWQVEVGNRIDVREFVYVDAHTGKIIDTITGIHEAKNRRAFDGAGSATAPGPNYPGTPFWVEGQNFPTGLAEADNMIAASSDIYDLFKFAFGRDSFDGNGATMDSIYNRGYGCPNASWNGTFISFCPGTTTDDITAHEWAHAYTQYTDNLIYQWQPGALNEAYSDIWGETVDRLNGRGTDTPNTPRVTGVCAVDTTPSGVTITAPGAIAGLKPSGTAAFGPQTFTLSSRTVTGVGVGTTNAACAALPANSLTGQIAFIDRGTCGFSVKAKNAEDAGAAAVIIGNNTGGTVVVNMAATAGVTVTIPTLSVTQNDGTAIKAQLALTAVTASMTRLALPSYDTVRWLLGEDSTAFGGAIRDMYNPTCYGNPGKVSDAQYACSTADSGGVHGNSGVANHGYALVVDGGSYNGQSITAIGLTKAAHIYYRAQSVYQGPTSGFPDHADALAQSCTDLTGVNLPSLTTGLPSGEVIAATDCAQLAKTALAVEFRTPPTQCQFIPMLAKSPPALCDTGTVTSILSDNFEGGKRTGVRWLLSHAGTTADYTARDWGVAKGLPGNRPGFAIFAVDYTGGTCAVGGDQSGVMHLDSPEITIPAGATPKLTFDHWMASEVGFDGGNVKISVNGGAWQLLKAVDFIYNAYNTALTTAAAGNTNPMAGEPAFSGADGGSVTGSWGRSIVNLAPYAVATDKVRLRFDLGTDGCGGTFGWYLDDVMVYQCKP